MKSQLGSRLRHVETDARLVGMMEEGSREAPPAPLPAWAEPLVRLLDDGLVLPGTGYRFGLDGIVGLLFPGAGDAVMAIAALSLFGLALQRGVPRPVLVRMALNIAIDALLGSVPIAGDVFDFAWKANRKNLRLLERATQMPPEARSGADRWVLASLSLLVACVLSLPILLIALLVAHLHK